MRSMLVLSGILAGLSLGGAALAQPAPARQAASATAPIVVAGPGAGGGYEQRIRRKKKPRSGFLAPPVTAA